MRAGVWYEEQGNNENRKDKECVVVFLAMVAVRMLILLNVAIMAMLMAFLMETLMVVMVLLVAGNLKIPKKQAFQPIVAVMDSIDIIARFILKNKDCVRVLKLPR